MRVGTFVLAAQFRVRARGRHCTVRCGRRRSPRRPAWTRCGSPSITSCRTGTCVGRSRWPRYVGRTRTRPGRHGGQRAAGPRTRWPSREQAALLHLTSGGRFAGRGGAAPRVDLEVFGAGGSVYEQVPELLRPAAALAARLRGEPRAERLAFRHGPGRAAPRRGANGGTDTERVLEVVVARTSPKSVRPRRRAARRCRSACTSGTRRRREMVASVARAARAEAGRTPDEIIAAPHVSAGVAQIGDRTRRRPEALLKAMPGWPAEAGPGRPTSRSTDAPWAMRTPRARGAAVRPPARS